MKKLLKQLTERAKELNCLYQVDEILKDFSSDLRTVLTNLLEAIHPGWQYVDVCKARICYRGTCVTSEGFRETSWFQKADITVDNEKVGKIEVFYVEKVKNDDDNPFLQEEQKLLNTIAEKLGNYFFHRRLREIFQEWKSAHSKIELLQQSEGKILSILENTDIDKIASYLQKPSKDIKSPEELEVILNPYSESHWRWRKTMAEKISEKLPAKKFGVKVIYLFGSTKNASAGPASDIDLLLHIDATEQQKQQLTAWLQGYSLCLAEINKLKTGYETGGLLDFHLITDEDIANKTSFAVKIGVVTDAARLLKDYRK
ncbi:MAG: nucleotidyltransferase domain-containing protein [Candidatus Cloacimonadota bacterium]|nr:nucleotidyltransferase domain-containing protein [Candidatus Cloacimonadota bacterium]